MTPDLQPPARPAASLTLPLRLPYPELSRLGTAWAAGQTFTLPLPTAPSLRVTKLQFSAAGPRLNVTLSVQSSGLLGLKATFDLSGRPVLDVAGQVLTLEDIAVSTHREGLSGRLIGLLADARVTAYLTRLARVDLGPRLAALQAQAGPSSLLGPGGDRGDGHGHAPGRDGPGGHARRPGADCGGGRGVAGDAEGWTAPAWVACASLGR